MSTIENFSASKYQNLGLSIPPSADQTLIADYLVKASMFTMRFRSGRWANVIR